MCNSEKHPEAWAFFEEHARNMEGTEFERQGKYRIPYPSPDAAIRFIYSNDPCFLWGKFIKAWYEERLDSPSIYGKIQYIVNNF